MWEALVCDRADFPLRVARAFARRLPNGFEMLLGTADLEAAYRKIPNESCNLNVVSLMNPETVKNSSRLKFWSQVSSGGIQ